MFTLPCSTRSSCSSRGPSLPRSHPRPGRREVSAASLQGQASARLVMTMRGTLARVPSSADNLHTPPSRLTVNPGSPIGPGNPVAPGLPWPPGSPFSPVGPSRPYRSTKISVSQERGRRSSICDQLWHAGVAPFLQGQGSSMVPISQMKTTEAHNRLPGQVSSLVRLGKVLSLYRQPPLGVGLLHTFQRGKITPVTSSPSQQPREVSREGMISPILEMRKQSPERLRDFPKDTGEDRTVPALLRGAAGLHKARGLKETQVSARPPAPEPRFPAQSAAGTLRKHAGVAQPRRHANVPGESPGRPALALTGAPACPVSPFSPFSPGLPACPSSPLIPAGPDFPGGPWGPGGPMSPGLPRGPFRKY